MHKIIGRAFNGKQAVKLTEKLRPNIIVMDMQMTDPDSGGQDLTAGIKATRIIQEKCPTPAIMLTAHGDPDLIKQANAAGVIAYLTKPPDMDELDRTIAIAVARFKDMMEVKVLNKRLQEEIARRKQSEKKIKYMATHDALTNLPNRWLFNDRIKLEIARAKRNKQKFVLMMIDLDYLKTVNDSLGHGAGDELLKIVGERLRTLLRESDTVARVGGDEFVLLLPGIKDNEAIEKAAKRILDSIKRPIILNRRKAQITTSIGIALYPDDGVCKESLMKSADRAVYYVKENGRNNYHCYDDTIDYKIEK